jgi:hypothetical protein
MLPIVHIQWLQLTSITSTIRGGVKGMLIFLPEEINYSSSFCASNEMIVLCKSLRVVHSTSSMSSPINDGWKTTGLVSALTF